MSSLRIEPLPERCGDAPCKFCQGPAQARITIGNGRRLRLLFRICDACLTSWRAELDRGRSVA